MTSCLQKHRRAIASVPPMLGEAMQTLVLCHSDGPKITSGMEFRWEMYWQHSLLIATVSMLQRTLQEQFHRTSIRLQHYQEGPPPDGCTMPRVLLKTGAAVLGMFFRRSRLLEIDMVLLPTTAIKKEELSLVHVQVARELVHSMLLTGVADLLMYSRRSPQRRASTHWLQMVAHKTRLIKEARRVVAREEAHRLLPIGVAGLGMCWQPSRLRGIDTHQLQTMATRMAAHQPTHLLAVNWGTHLQRRIGVVV